MAASDHVQPQQLQMFMPAHQLLATHDLGDRHDVHDQTMDEKNYTMGWKLAMVKRNRAKYNFSQGIMRPLEIVQHEGEKPHLHEGHHRLADALDRNPHTEVPIVQSFKGRRTD